MDASTLTALQTALFRNVIRHRPIGLHKHFAMVAIQRSLEEEFDLADSSCVWDLLAEYYDLKEMDSVDEAYVEDNPLEFTTHASTSKNESQSIHWQEDDTAFSLLPLETSDPSFEELLLQRRFRASPSPDHAGDTPDVGSPLTDASSVSGKDANSPRKSKKGRRQKSPPSTDDQAMGQDEEEEIEEEEEPVSSPAAKPRQTQKARGRGRGRKSVASSANSRPTVEIPSDKAGATKLSGAAAISARKKAEREAKEAVEEEPPTPSSTTTGRNKRKR